MNNKSQCFGMKKAAGLCMAFLITVPLLAQRKDMVRKVPSGGDPKPAAFRDMGQIYDPLQDPHCKIIDQSLGQISGHSKWDAFWMWYPGQYTAALHARVVQQSLKRCTYISYPGNFTQPQPLAYFRAKANPVEKALIRWEGASGRTRLLIDHREVGEITRRDLTLQPGRRDIDAIVDFASGLPCLILEGAGVSSPAGWEVSLDGKTWTTPEYIKEFKNPGIVPDYPADITLRIPVKKVLHPVNVEIRGDAYEFGNGGEAVFDFWHDELGCLAFDVQGRGEIFVFVGESPEEAMNRDTSSFEQKALAPIILSASDTSIILPERCLRYARIHTTGACRVSNLHFRARVTPVEYRGHFTCSDQKLNLIWKAGAATLHACMHDFHLDGIKRDGLTWSYDGQIAMKGGDMVFYDRTIARNTNVSQLLPENPEQDDIGIADYPLHTILGFEHEYAVSGDLNFLRIYKTRIYELLDLYMTLQDENGFVSGSGFVNWGFFPDWGSSKAGPAPRGTPAYAQMLLMHALETGAYFARELSDSHKAAIYEKAAGMLRINIRKEFWDSGRGSFINGFDAGGKPDKRLTPYAQVWGIIFGLVRPEEYQGVFDKVLDSPERGSFLETQVAQNLFYEMQACFQTGRTERAVKMTREIWGRLIDAGYSRFMEDIHLDQTPVDQLAFYNRPFGKSLCHSWSGALPVYVLSRGVLGISPISPGYRRCTFHPDLGGLEWVKGSVPVPGGSISVEMDRSSGKLTLPPGVEVSLVNVTGENGEQSFRGPGIFPFRWVNLYHNASTVWSSGDNKVKVSVMTHFPEEDQVELKINTSKSVKMSVKLRIPLWCRDEVMIYLSGQQAGTGKPGTFFDMERKWKDSDTIRFRFPVSLRVHRYEGEDKLEDMDRYAIFYGPSLLACVGNMDNPALGRGYDSFNRSNAYVPRIRKDPFRVSSWLIPDPDQPGYFTIEGVTEHRFIPYRKLGNEEPFTCYPGIGNNS